MKRKSSLMALALLVSGVAIAQDKQPLSPPRQRCEYDGSRGNESLRLVNGEGEAPFFFACETNNPNAGPNGCIDSTLPSGTVISLDREVDGWTCIHGEGPLSGWMPSSRLGPMPQAPAPPMADWVGWWRKKPDTERRKNGRILITRGKTPNSLRVSGREYWYGLNGSVNFGQVNAEALPVGSYLHAVSDRAGGCVVNLQLSHDELGSKLQIKDNEKCGGMNVRFMGVWRKFTTR